MLNVCYCYYCFLNCGGCNIAAAATPAERAQGLKDLAEHCKRFHIHPVKIPKGSYAPKDPETQLRACCSA